MAPIDVLLARLRTFTAWNFVISIVVAILWFLWQGVTGLEQSDPTRLRINRVPLGAAFLVLIQLVLLVLYRRRGEITPLVRVFAGVLGVVQLLQSAVVPWIASLAYEQPFPTSTQEVSWYLCASNLLFALVGPPRHPQAPEIRTEPPR